MHIIPSPIVLMYHGIISNSIQSPQKRETGADLYDVRAEDFHAQMEYLREHRFAVTRWSHTQQKTTGKRAVITFDDGELNNYSEAFPILKKFTFPAYFFITANRIGTPDYMDWKHLRELHQYGMVIGSHGLSHDILTGLSDRNLHQELFESKKILEIGLKYPIDSISIPRGFYDDRVIRVAKEAGYREIFVSDIQKNCSHKCIGRIAVKGTWSMKRFEQAINGKTPFPEKIFQHLKSTGKNFLGGKTYNQLRTILLKSKR